MALELTPDVYRAVLDSLPMGVYLVDRDRRIVLWNAESENLTGYLGQEVVGHCCQDGILMHCDENSVILCGAACPLAHTMHDGRPREADVFLRHKDGQRIPVRVRAAPLRREDGSIIGAVESFEERQLQPAADTHDRGVDVSICEVTEVPDREAMRKGLQAALEEFAVTPVPFGVLSMTVDHLDRLRCTYGRRAVNAILYVTAKTLAKNLPNGMMGRWCRDGFLAILPGCRAPELMKSAETLKKRVSVTGVPWWGDRLSVTLSVGGAMVRPGDTLESLSGRAAEALEASMRESGDGPVVA